MLLKAWNFVSSPIRALGRQLDKSEAWFSEKYEGLAWRTGNGFFSSSWSSLKKALSWVGSVVFSKMGLGGFVVGLTLGLSVLGLPSLAWLFFTNGFIGLGLFVTAFIVSEFIVHGMALDHLVRQPVLVAA